MQLSVHLFGVVWVAVLLSFSLCQDKCRVQDGKPGQPGVSGRDGWAGQKGEKGDAGLQVELNRDKLIALKGDKGEIGPVGVIGPKGYNGHLGPPGPEGPSGNPGSSLGGGLSSSKTSAFTVFRKNDYPMYNNPVTFNEELTNLNTDFNLNTGFFTCKVPGVYYFVFHAVSEGDLCLKIRSDSNAQLKLTFCDYYQRRPTTTYQVLSGGVVLKLAKENKVWLEPAKIAERNKETNRMSKSQTSVFSGFLIFASG